MYVLFITFSILKHFTNYFPCITVMTNDLILFHTSYSFLPLHSLTLLKNSSLAVSLPLTSSCRLPCFPDVTVNRTWGEASVLMVLGSPVSFLSELVGLHQEESTHWLPSSCGNFAQEQCPCPGKFSEKELVVGCELAILIFLMVALWLCRAWDREVQGGTK